MGINRVTLAVVLFFILVDGAIVWAIYRCNRQDRLDIRKKSLNYKLGVRENHDR